MIVYIILYAITISHGLYLHNPRNLRFSQSTFRSYLFLWFISIAQRSVYDIHPSTKDQSVIFETILFHITKLLHYFQIFEQIGCISRIEIGI